MIWWIAAVVIVLDQLTKLWAVRALSPDPNRAITIIPNFLQLAWATNQGGAAGLLHHHPQLLTLLSLAALGIILWWAHTVPLGEKLARFGFGLILGGAMGNLLDRLFRGGFVLHTYVVDFIDAHWYYRIHWPTFNVADSCICIGIAIVLLAHLRPQHHTLAAQPQETKTAATAETDQTSAS